MNERVTTPDKIDMLLKWIPKKGSDALARFIVCLRKSADGTGHDELATLLEDEIRKVRQCKAGLVKSSKGNCMYTLYAGGGMRSVHSYTKLLLRLLKLY